MQQDRRQQDGGELFHGTIALYQSLTLLSVRVKCNLGVWIRDSPMLIRDSMERRLLPVMGRGADTDPLPAGANREAAAESVNSQDPAPMSDEQVHPLYRTDRDTVDGLLGHPGEPGPEQLTRAAMLLIRYKDFPGAQDIKDDLERCLTNWSLQHEELNLRCREIWASGWRPGQATSNEVGSGADVQEQDGL